MEKKIDVLEYSTQILTALKTGVLMTTKAGDSVNTMTISWGSLGIQWNKPIFIAYVRESRYTKELLNKNLEFTINIPIANYDKKTLSTAGTKSGRDIDKLKELNLSAHPSSVVSVPGIQEFPLTLECKVIYTKEQDESAISKENLEKFYPIENENKRDLHTVYYGEIVNAYIIEEE